MFRECSEHMEHQPIRMRIVAADEIDATLHEGGYERNVPAQAVKLGDHQLSLLLFAQFERGEKLRAIPVTLSAFDLGELCEKHTVADKAHDKVFLGRESQS